MTTKVRFPIIVSILAACIIIGCNTSQQTTAYNTIFSLQRTVSASYSGYLDATIKGSVSTNSLPKISKAFNDFQAAAQVAMDAVQYNTNALASPALLTEGQDVINLIKTAK